MVIWFTHRFNSDFKTNDKNLHTPITIVLAEWEKLRYHALIKKDTVTDAKRSNAVKVINIILDELESDYDRITAITMKYHGISAIEYDIKSGYGIIVEVRVN